MCTCMVFTPGACGSVGLSLLPLLLLLLLLEAPRELPACKFEGAGHDEMHGIHPC